MPDKSVREATIMAGYLKLNKILMPAPKPEGIAFSSEKIWSKNTGRTSSSKMVGDIKAIKDTVSIEFPPLSMSDIKKLGGVVNNKALPFFECEIYDGETLYKKTVYAGAPGYKLYSTVDGIRLYTGYKIDLVEQ